MALVKRQEDTAEDSAVYSIHSEENTPLATRAYENESESTLVFTAEPQAPTKEESYVFSRDIFVRFLALIYFVSFLGHFNQDVGLVGGDGVWPAGAFLYKVIEGLYDDGILSVSDKMPGIFSLIPICDISIRLLAVAGMVISLLIALTGIVGCGACLTLWLIKFSLVSLLVNLPRHNADLLLLEAGFLAVFLFSPFMVFERQGQEWELPVICRWSYRFLLYRVMFCAGISKIRGSIHWFDSTAFKYLLQSITLPNPLTHYLYNIMVNYPTANMIATNILLFVECVASVFLLVPIRSCAILGGVIAMVYALFFNAIGNFGYFYLLLACCSIFCFDDEVLEKIIYNPFKKDEEEVEEETQEEVAEADVEQQAPDVEHENEGFAAKVMRFITWQPKKRAHKDDVIYLQVFGVDCDDNPYLRMLESVQILIVFLISFVTFNMILGRPNIGMKVVIVFFLALQLQVFDILENDIGLLTMWSSVGINELNIGLSRTASKLHKITRVMMQLVVVLTSMVYYSLPLVIRSINFKHPGVGFKAPFGIVNSYNGFGMLPEERFELLIQGTDDSVIGSNTEWKTYELHGMPGDINKRPWFVVGYNYELDNLVHDINNRDAIRKPKVVSLFMLEFIRALLHNKENVSGLLEYNPFHLKAPKYVRVMQYKYQFGGPNDNTWYKRQPHAQVVPPLTLDRVNENENFAKVISEPHKEIKAEEPAQNNAVPPASNVVHVVHKMPPARNIRGVPLEMAENFVQSTPVTDSLMLTRV